MVLLRLWKCVEKPESPSLKGRPNRPKFNFPLLETFVPLSFDEGFDVPFSFN
jgi:hypothetical protein